MSVGPDDFRRALSRFATGVTVVTARDGAGRDFGMTVSAFSSLSLEPPLVLVCVDHTADMHAVLRDTARFAVNILAAAQSDIARRFSDPELDRFDGLTFSRAEAAGGAPVLSGVLGHLECVKRHAHEGGDHTIFVGLVEAATWGQGEPLLYFRGDYSGGSSS